MITPPVAVCWVSVVTALARPKSATLTRPPDDSSAIRTFSGLMSRWTTPARWAAASAETTGSSSASGLGRRHRGLGADHVAQGVTGDQLHHQVEGAALDVRVLALVEDVDDVRVREPGGGAGLALEPVGERGVVAEAAVHGLDRAHAVETDVDGLVDGGHATACDAATDPVAPVEEVPGQGVGERGAARVGARVVLHVDPPSPVGEVARRGHPTDGGRSARVTALPARRGRYSCEQILTRIAILVSTTTDMNSTRPYTMTTRARAVEETRARIIDACVALHGERPVTDIALDDIAGRAGVSVQTVLRHFGSRAGPG